LSIFSSNRDTDFAVSLPFINGVCFWLPGDIIAYMPEVDKTVVNSAEKKGGGMGHNKTLAAFLPPGFY
jgi:hypothetical protein